MGVKVRIRLPAGGDRDLAMVITTAPPDGGPVDPYTNELPAKEWSIVDDVSNVADTVSFTVANEEGENSGKFYMGQLLTLDESDDQVAGGDWIRHFTGRVTSIETGSDAGGGSVILVRAMDLGWHLTSSCAQPLQPNKRGKLQHVQIKNKKLAELLKVLIDPTWGIDVNVQDGDLNTRLKHGRQVIIQNHKPVLGAILPFIQVEPGQKPWEILSQYFQREGLLLNIGARGELIVFRPHYDDQPLFWVDYYPVKDSRSSNNNAKGRPSLRETIDGMYSDTQCWSTVIIPPSVANTENPNEMYRHDSYTPDVNPLPFKRTLVFSDGEAINPRLRKNRAIWKQQMGMFDSWEYSVEIEGHSQNGAFFVSNAMISINDAVNKVAGTYYVQSVQRNCTIGGGTVSRLTIRKPGLLNPEFNSLLGAGAKKAAKGRKVVK